MTVPHDFVAGTINGLTVTKAATGFTIAGGTTSKTLTLDANLTASAVVTSSSAAASGGTTLSLVTTGEKYTWNNKSNLTIGTTSTTAAAGNHTHGISIENTGATTLELGYGYTYTLTAGGSSVAFKMPADNSKNYSAGTGLSLSGTTFNHSNSVTAGTAGTSSATSGSTLAVPYVTYDAQGHITATGTHTHTVTGFLTSHQTIKQEGIIGATVNRYASCTTTAGTAEKKASVTAGTFSLATGTRVTVNFSNKNTANNPTLNINSKGAKNIFHNGAQITSGANKGLLCGACDFVYDGTQWLLIGNYVDTNNTYTVNNGTLTIKGGSTTATTFTANSSTSPTLTISGSRGTTVTAASGTITVSSPQIYSSTSAPTSSDGSNGDIWIQYTA
jgi:hypothetical protein